MNTHTSEPKQSDTHKKSFILNEEGKKIIKISSEDFRKIT